MEHITRTPQRKGHVVVLSREKAFHNSRVYGFSSRTQASHVHHLNNHNTHPLDSGFSRIAARILIWLLVFQPVYVAMGMELDPATSTSSLTTTQADDSESSPTEDNGEENNVSNESVSLESNAASEISDEDTTSDALVDDTENLADEDSADVTTEDAQTEIDVGSDVVNDVDGQQDSDNVLGQDTETVTGDDTSTEDDTDLEPNEDVADESSGGASDNETASEDAGGGGNNGDTSEEVVTEDEEDENDTMASSSEEILGDSTDEAGTTTTSKVEIISVHQAEGSFVFNDGDCTLVADGEFYCVKKDVQKLTQGDQRVYSKQDIEGDREIYYFDGMEEHRVTNNSYDDFAPIFDEDTLRIVWQAMINDRLQIMYHELPSNTTRQITTARENSSNPHITGTTVVWQQWIDTNWEIMMTDVDNNGGPFEIEQLTDNAVHDMFPQAYDDVITWQREKGGSWEIIVFDPRSGKETALQKNDGTKYENPRFVLLFDSKHENGDVETIGYDLDTGEMMELGTRGNQQPEDPKTPKDETQDAIPREATSTAQLKPVKEDDDTGLDL